MKHCVPDGCTAFSKEPCVLYTGDKEWVKVELSAPIPTYNMVTWLHSNGSSDGKWFKFYDSNNMFFENEEDAILFSLKWL